MKSTQRVYQVWNKFDQLVDDATTEEDAQKLVDEFDDYDEQSAPHYYEEIPRCEVCGDEMDGWNRLTSDSHPEGVNLFACEECHV